MRTFFRLFYTVIMCCMAVVAAPTLATTPDAHGMTTQTVSATKAMPATKEAPLVLYYRDDCPYCWNVLSHLNDQHRTLPMKEINESTEAAAELVQGGGKRQVPCLRIRENNGNKVTWLYQSEEIIKYLDNHPQS